jgi:hypothetical protein
MDQNQKGINEAAGKTIGKEERPQINSWFDEECQLILEDRKTAYNKMINRNIKQNKQEYKDKRKEEHKTVDKKDSSVSIKARANGNCL